MQREKKLWGKDTAFYSGRSNRSGILAGHRATLYLMEMLARGSNGIFSCYTLYDCHCNPSKPEFDRGIQPCAVIFDKEE
ncbi:MAG: hypothetical protein ACOX7K_03035 [Oscillospiraceae bacterium]|jgi:hypothetical protein